MVDQIKEYLKLHILSLEQDRDEVVSTVGDESVDWEFVSGQIHASQHILSYINELDNALYEGV